MAISRRASGVLPDRGHSRALLRSASSSDRGNPLRAAGKATSIGCGEPAGHQVPFTDAGSLAQPSKMTCALLPESPKALTPARGGLPLVSGQAIISEVMRTGMCSHSKLGFGLRKCRCAGMIPLFIASTALMMLAMPDAHSECPMLVLTDPSSRGRSASRSLPYTADMARSSMESPSSVPAPWASR